MSSKSKYLIDTSIFSEMFKNDLSTFETFISSYAGGRRFAAYYTAIELNRGFLQTMVEHHQKVLELQNAPAAVILLSNKYGTRKSKYGNILQAYMMRFAGSASGDYRVYSATLESVIFDMTDRANDLVKRFIGHFEKHALAALSLYANEDYDDFLKRCKTSGDVDFKDFWFDHETQIYKMRERILNKCPRLKKAELELFYFLEELLGGSIEPDYEHTSDFAISLECPRSHKMVAHDKSFDMFMPLQDKTGGYVTLR